MRGVTAILLINQNHRREGVAKSIKALNHEEHEEHKGKEKLFFFAFRGSLLFRAFCDSLQRQYLFAQIKTNSQKNSLAISFSIMKMDVLLLFSFGHGNFFLIIWSDHLTQTALYS